MQVFVWDNGKDYSAHDFEFIASPFGESDTLATIEATRGKYDTDSEVLAMGELAKVKGGDDYYTKELKEFIDGHVFLVWCQEWDAFLVNPKWHEVPREVRKYLVGQWRWLEAWKGEKSQECLDLLEAV